MRSVAQIKRSLRDETRCLCFGKMRLVWLAVYEVLGLIGCVGNACFDWLCTKCLVWLAVYEISHSESIQISLRFLVSAFIGQGRMAKACFWSKGDLFKCKITIHDLWTLWQAHGFAKKNNMCIYSECIQFEQSKQQKACSGNAILGHYAFILILRHGKLFLHCTVYSWFFLRTHAYTHHKQMYQHETLFLKKKKKGVGGGKTLGLYSQSQTNIDSNMYNCFYIVYSIFLVLSLRMHTSHTNLSARAALFYLNSSVVVFLHKDRALQVFVFNIFCVNCSVCTKHAEA